MTEPIQSLLAAADPVSGVEDARLRGLVRSMADDVRTAATTEPAVMAPWWKRRRAIIPLGIASVVALTAAGLPLTMGIDGMRVDPDAVIPIVYTTDTGADVSCRYGIYFGNPADRSALDKQLAAFVKDHDWTGIGQAAYEYAIANPFVPGRDGGLQWDTQQNRDVMSLNIAISHMIEDEIPDELRNADPAVSGALDNSTTDCTTGQLH
ncbi:hypothetical protein [Microbacterium sp. Root166]|uniref:hypothetical protein n=1 Tax=Microbacterium sp. Root166 TaxID=1736478 RepID=UPI000AE62E2F|nr:hypothetical protein [Microbacterium sp. Root166]